MPFLFILNKKLYIKFDMNDIFEDNTSNFIKIENEIMLSPLSMPFRSEDCCRFIFSKEDEYPSKIDSFYKKDKEEKINIFPLYEKTTDIQTIYKDYSNQSIKNSEKKEEKNFYSFESIIEILQNSQTVDFNKIQSYLIKDSRIEKAENNLQLIKNKRKRSSKSDEMEKFYNKIKFGLGRKKSNDISERDHNKFSSDNIIKKIKGKIFQYLVIFMNNILGRKEEDKNKIYKINYKYIDKVNKKNDLEILEKSLKDLLSVEITTKVKVVDRYFNKGFIERIINKEEPLKDYDTILFVLNIKLRDWLSLFTFKKEIDDIIKEKVEEEYTQKINKKIIEESLIGVDDLINQMIKENNEQFLLFFIFHLYNYERWFFIRAGRNIKS